ncbi:hypothetical protein BKA82DRAFT_1009365 [Pisolithus tinctorius]|uniref:Uncharacterized protein n=1 Tax=Pisolithus tinctorius Marx 270 TaxID=870435 RepID=A0A0C3J534_PISTI|nr:hypothetical protein BKA82DRAFT_1009365 [Pisolithus tinctorius]KIN92791.1 hypothetical protein M404DRAFT_1009365 [Pisolithus tinctorius Marx 270]
MKGENEQLRRENHFLKEKIAQLGEKIEMHTRRPRSDSAARSYDGSSNESQRERARAGNKLGTPPRLLWYHRPLNPPSRIRISLLPARRLQPTFRLLPLQLLMTYLVMQQLPDQAPSTPSGASCVVQTPPAVVERLFFSK